MYAPFSPMTWPEVLSRPALWLKQAAFWEAADSGPDVQALMLDLDLDVWLSGPFVDLL